MVAEFVNYIPIVISIAAFGVSIITYIKKSKSDQFRIAVDIQNQLEESVNKLILIEERLNDKALPEVEKKALNRQRKSMSLYYLNILEFLALLIRRREITNKNIIRYFKPSIKDESKQVFEDYPDIEQDPAMYEEIKELLEQWKRSSNN